MRVLRLISLLFIVALLANAALPARAQIPDQWGDPGKPECGVTTDLASSPILSSGPGDLAVSLGAQTAWKYFSKTADGRASGLRHGDFNGDGATDFFRVVVVPDALDSWQIRTVTGGEWVQINTAAEAVGVLRFGDFNGDGKTDVFHVGEGGQWRYSSAGASKWINLANDAFDTPLANLRFGDFDGDGETDLFRTRAGANGYDWLMSPGGATDWQLLRSGEASVSNLRFGYFNGDAVTDVFTLVPEGATSRWRVYYGGVSDPVDLESSSAPLADLRFGDFDGDGRTDVLDYNGGTEWRYSSAGQSKYGYAFAQTNTDLSADYRTLNLETAGVPALPFYGRPRQLFLLGFPIDITVSDIDPNPGTEIFLTTNEGYGTVYNDTPAGAPDFEHGNSFSFGFGGSLSRYVAVADSNGDGRLDTLISKTGESEIEARLQGLSNWQPVHSSLDHPSILRVADVDLDGRDDLVVMVSSGVDVLRNTTAPFSSQVSFTRPQPTFFFGAPLSDVAIADFNADGRPDLLAILREQRQAVARLNLSENGGFTMAPPQSFELPLFPFRGAVADMNGDRRPDIVLVEGDAEVQNDNSVIHLHLLFNATAAETTALAFVATPPLTTAAVSFALVVSEIDGDGRRDVILDGGSQTRTYLNRTTALATEADFLPAALRSVGHQTVFLRAADLNADGRADIVAMDHESYTVLLNFTRRASLNANAGDGQSAPVGQPFATPLRVRVLDGCNRPLAGVRVLFSAPATGARATFGAAAVTDEEGFASTVATAAGQPGSYEVSAFLPGTDTRATFALQNTAAPPTETPVPPTPEGTPVMLPIISN